LQTGSSCAIIELLAYADSSPSHMMTVLYLFSKTPEPEFYS